MRVTEPSAEAPDAGGNFDIEKAPDARYMLPGSPPASGATALGSVMTSMLANSYLDGADLSESINQALPKCLTGNSSLYILRELRRKICRIESIRLTCTRLAAQPIRFWLSAREYFLSA
jgi:hypothetical protein